MTNPSFWRGLKRHRALFLFGGAIVAAILSFLSDPDGGLSTLLGGLSLIQGVWAIGCSHWARKALMDYPEADMRSLFRKASEESTGSGLALIAVAIVLFGLMMVFSPRAKAAEIPPNAITYLPMLKAEQFKYWANHPAPETLAGLVEQESCVSLKSSRCWSPKAQLKTEREEGAGVGQVTRAYRKDGSLRFDTIANLRDKYNSLSELSWANVYSRPDLQFRALVLLSKESAAPFRNAAAMLEFGDAAYNGGVSDVQKERRACQLTSGCDAGKWFGNVENHCVKSRQPIYGTRSACDINREHVKNVMQIRRAKYRQYMS